MQENKIMELCMNFSIRIVKLYKLLSIDKKENIMSKQLLRCGTSIGANVWEAQNAQSKPDFGAKMNISLKEANETLYWLELLTKTEFITQQEYCSINNEAIEIKKILAAIVKTTFAKSKKPSN